MEHSPLPWTVTTNNGAIYSWPEGSNACSPVAGDSDHCCVSPEDAKLIVTAVNAHHELLAALKDARANLLAALNSDLIELVATSGQVIDALGAAITKAEATHV